jgi:Raf kinase inhibitor-like YbhB/YbcL family protein
MGYNVVTRSLQGQVDACLFYVAASKSHAIARLYELLEGGAGSMILNLRSTGLMDGQAIPKKYTADGQDVSPPLTWNAGPSSTKEFALVCDDPDAPTAEPWVHWVIYKIPPDVTSLPEGLPQGEILKQPAGALQGKNSFTSGAATGYRGPAPPKGHGTHHYHFKLFALDTKLNLRAGATKRELLAAMAGHVVADGELVGTYER